MNKLTTHKLIIENNKIYIDVKKTTKKTNLKCFEYLCHRSCNVDDAKNIDWIYTKSKFYNKKIRFFLNTYENHLFK